MIEAGNEFGAGTPYGEWKLNLYELFSYIFGETRFFKLKKASKCGSYSDLRVFAIASGVAAAAFLVPSDISSTAANDQM